MRRQRAWRVTWGALLLAGLAACGGAPLPEEAQEEALLAQEPGTEGVGESTVEALHQSQRPHGETRWARVASGPDEDRGMSVAHDSQGNVYSLGRFFGTADFGTGPMGPGGFTFLTGLAKYRPDGTLAWARVFPLVSGFRVATDSRGDVIVVGGAFEGGDLGGGPLPGGSGFIAKFSSAGTLRWVRSVPLPLRNLAVDRRDCIIVSGLLDSPADFGGGTLTDVGHPFIAKYSSKGDFRWAIVDPVPDLDLDLAADEDGNLYLAGRAPTASSVGAYLRKICRSGELEWNRILDVDGVGFGVSVAARGNDVVLGGFFEGTLTFAGRSFSTPGISGFVAAFNSHGKERWARALGSDSAFVGLDSDDGVLVTGRYATGEDLGRGPAPGTPGETTNMYVLRLDVKNGRTDWVRTIAFGGLTPAELSVSRKGAPAVVGSFGGPVDFGTGLLTPVSDDVFTVQFER